MDVKRVSNRRAGQPELRGRAYVPRQGSNGFATKESLDALYEYVSKHYGKGSPGSASYFPDSDYQATIDYAERFSKEHACYNVLLNNCKTFAFDAATACREGNKYE